MAYAEPSILMSFDKIILDIVAKWDSEDSEKMTLIKPYNGKGIKIRMWDKGTPLKFISIPEIVNILPHIKKSLPFVTPEKLNRRYLYKGWVSMITEKQGTWL